jgi:hypothetical protein
VGGFGRGRPRHKSGRMDTSTTRTMAAKRWSASGHSSGRPWSLICITQPSALGLLLLNVLSRAPVNQRCWFEAPKAPLAQRRLQAKWLLVGSCRRGCWAGGVSAAASVVGLQACLCCSVLAVRRMVAGWMRWLGRRLRDGRGGLAERWGHSPGRIVGAAGGYAGARRGARRSGGGGREGSGRRCTWRRWSGWPSSRRR